jgi:hypothetical protein
LVCNTFDPYYLLNQPTVDVTNTLDREFLKSVFGVLAFGGAQR